MIGMATDVKSRINEIELILSEIEMPAEECKNKLLVLQKVVDDKSFEIDSLFFKSCINFLMVPFIS